MQPNFVGQIGRTHGLVAFAVDAVTSSASAKFGFAKTSFERVMRTARQAQHVVGDIADIVWCTHRLCHGRHVADTTQGDG